MSFKNLSAGPATTVSLFSNIKDLAYERRILTRYNEGIYGGERKLNVYDLDSGQELDEEDFTHSVKENNFGLNPHHAALIREEMKRKAESLQPAA